MTMSMESLRRLPKVLLHDHLDGGMRATALVELAADVGHTLPTTDPHELAGWYVQPQLGGSLELYMEKYTHTIAAMQTREALLRTAEEYVLDLAADGVVYGETRYAPELHLRRGLSVAAVVECVQEGLASGVAKALEAGSSIHIRTLLSAMRNARHSREVADLAIAFRDDGVVGFDIAGPEDGFRPSAHLEAFDRVHRQGMPVTIHAGEAFGLPSIWEAVHICRAERLGHGIRIADNIFGLGSGGNSSVTLGPLASWVRDRRIALEVCPTSNIQTGAAVSIAEHPITALLELGFQVTLNTDSRLVAGTSMTREMSLLMHEAGWTLDQLYKVTANAMESAFIPYDERMEILKNEILPVYAEYGG